MTISLEAHLAARGLELRDLPLLARIQKKDLPALLGRHPRTVKRWFAAGRAPDWTFRTLALLAGFFPWPGWEGFFIEDGLLYVPGEKYGYSPQDLRALHWLKQLDRLHRAAG